MPPPLEMALMAAASFALSLSLLRADVLFLALVNIVRRRTQTL